jgi:hypothetical protein
MAIAGASKASPSPSIARLRNLDCFHQPRGSLLEFGRPAGLSAEKPRSAARTAPALGALLNFAGINFAAIDFAGTRLIPAL